MGGDYDISAAFAAIEDELIASMIRNMKRHKQDEIDEDKQWSMWQAEQLKSLEQYRRKNQKKYGSEFAKMNAKIEALIRAARDEGEMDQEIAILEAIKKGFTAKRIPKGATAEFFKLNERKLEALIKATTDDMEKAETAVLRMANDQYRKAIFNAQVYANTGAGTYEKAVDMATRDMLSAGLNCIEYKNGARHTLADYADMAIRTASKRAYLQGEGTKRQEWGITTVIVNKRGNPCPKCLPFVGKVLVDDVWSGGNSNGKSPVTGLKYPLMSKAIAAGLYHPRCKDSHTTYFEGISTPPDGKYTRDELDQIAEDYRREQQGQYAAHQAEKYDRLAKYSLDKENQERYAARREEWKRTRQASEQTTSQIDYAERRRQRLAERRKDITNPELNGPSFSNMNVAELQKYADEHLNTVFVDIKGANKDYVREAVKVISEFEEKMGGKTIKDLKIQFGNVPKGVYAKYDDSTNTLLLKKTGSIKAFEEAQKKDNARYRIKWHTDRDYYATETYSGTIWHELGHAVDIESGQSLSRRLAADPLLEEASLQVSSYAGTTQGVRVTKRSEAWAENFAAYMDGGRNSDKVPEEIRNMIDGYFKKHQKNRK